MSNLQLTKCMMRDPTQTPMLYTAPPQKTASASFPSTYCGLRLAHFDERLIEEFTNVSICHKFYQEHNSLSDSHKFHKHQPGHHRVHNESLTQQHISHWSSSYVIQYDIGLCVVPTSNHKSVLTLKF